MSQLLWLCRDSTAQGCARVERTLQSDWGRHRLQRGRILYAQNSAGCRGRAGIAPQMGPLLGWCGAPQAVQVSRSGKRG